MSKNIASVGLNIPGDQTTYLSLKSKSSLLDYDIVVIDPNISEFYGYPDNYLGKPCLSDFNSFELLEHNAHWRREILDALKAGKTVFVMLNEKEDVFVATGEKTYSGTGRNRQTTRHVTGCSNYEIIPGGIGIVNSKGTLMRLSGKAELLAVYWAELGPYSEYRVLVDGEGITPLVITKSGDKTVGASRRYKNASGKLVLLPYVEFYREGFTYKKKEEESEKDEEDEENEDDEEGKYYWTEEAEKFGKRFVSAIVGVDNVIRQAEEITPVPDWAMQKKYELPKELKTGADLLTVETKIESLQKEKEQLQQKLTEDTILKGLLFEKGKPLEVSIIEALRLLGFKASQYRNTESEFDVVFECPEGRLIGEAEGKDNKPISIEKLRQLEMNIHEDFAREGVDEIAKGVLIGNAYRLSAPEIRGDYFTEKCLTAAERSKIALIKSIDLFFAARYLSGNEDLSFAQKCREAILSATGIVIFPDISQEKTSSPEEVVACSRNEDRT
jgi:hypothetical protein